MITYLLIFSYSFIEFNSQILPYMFVIAGASIAVILVVQLSLNCILRKFDKLKVYKFATALAGVISTLVFVVTLPGIGNIGFYLLMIINVVLAGIVSALSLIDGLFVRDLVVFDTYVTGLRRENMYQMALNLPSNLAISIGSSIPLILCYMTGFVPGTNNVDDDHIVSKYLWNDSVIWQMRFYGRFLVTLICYISYFTIRNYPLNDKVSRKISDVVIKRDEVQAQSDKSDFTKAVHTKDVEVTTSVAEPEDIMFMNNFSQVEVRAFSENIDLMESLQQKQVIGITLAIICIIILCAGTGLQLMAPQSSFAVLNISLALILALYVGYEALRLTTLKKLKAMPTEDKSRLVSLARQSNEEYISKLANMLKKSGIDDSGAGDAAPDSNDIRETLAQADPAVVEDLKDAAHLPGYKRMYTAFLIIIIYGVIGCTLLVYKSPEPHSHGNSTVVH